MTKRRKTKPSSARYVQAGELNRQPVDDDIGYEPADAEVWGRIVGLSRECNDHSYKLTQVERTFRLLEFRDATVLALQNGCDTLMSNCPYDCGNGIQWSIDVAIAAVLENPQFQDSFELTRDYIRTLLEAGGHLPTGNGRDHTAA